MREEMEEILNFKFWILDWEEDEEVVFYGDLRSIICYFFLYDFRRSWSRMLQGRTGTGCPSCEEVVPRRMRGTAGGTPALPFDKAAYLSSVFCLL